MPTTAPNRIRDIVKAALLHDVLVLANRVTLDDVGYANAQITLQFSCWPDMIATGVPAAALSDEPALAAGALRAAHYAIDLAIEARGNRLAETTRLYLVQDNGNVGFRPDVAFDARANRIVVRRPAQPDFTYPVPLPMAEDPKDLAARIAQAFRATAAQ